MTVWTDRVTMEVLAKTGLVTIFANVPLEKQDYDAIWKTHASVIPARVMGQSVQRRPLMETLYVHVLWDGQGLTVELISMNALK